MSRIPGYNRYAWYQSEIAKQARPLHWLSEQEPAYWFIRRELGKLPKPASVLEIGSGLGYLSFALAREGYAATGIDISDQAVSRARALFGDLYARRDLFTLAADPDRYDAVILTEVIEHVTEPIAFLEAASALLKPGGPILMTTPNKSAAPLNACWKTENPPVHLWWFSETAIRQMARRAGLSVNFCDFTPMYTGREPEAGRSGLAGQPAWLDESGNVTQAALDWLAKDDRRQGLTRRLRSLVPHLHRAALHAKRRRRSSALIAQRSPTIGAILRKRP
ncbi:SAM-dependent methyltransferase [Methylobacterium sp. BE186]|uniref:class I SAM-dependent methyltransferase n=1 Tax=Methylobacterium sp. BE186 TaxID=2817715 RepID=UPI0028651631|nr:class I SAM-dependent methyltransferase [Methylobacterium sp. BE186]MDR7036757.1 SAM-dependent methyltransferase [Methylobacterium sp. BE186]